MLGRERSSRHTSVWLCRTARLTAQPALQFTSAPARSAAATRARLPALQPDRNSDSSWGQQNQLQAEPRGDPFTGPDDLTS